MVNSNTPEPASYATPWTLRAYDALPGNPIWIGLGFLVGLLAVFFLGRAFGDMAANSSADDLRVTITQFLQTAYAASAYAVCKNWVMVARHILDFIS